MWRLKVDSVGEWITMSGKSFQVLIYLLYVRGLRLYRKKGVQHMPQNKIKDVVLVADKLIFFWVGLVVLSLHQKVPKNLPAMSLWNGILHILSLISCFSSGMQGRCFVLLFKFCVHFSPAASTADFDILLCNGMFLKRSVLRRKIAQRYSANKAKTWCMM